MRNFIYLLIPSFVFSANLIYPIISTKIEQSYGCIMYSAYMNNILKKDNYIELSKKYELLGNVLDVNIQKYEKLINEDSSIMRDYFLKEFKREELDNKKITDIYKKHNQRCIFLAKERMLID